MQKRENVCLFLILLIAGFLRFYNLMHDSPYFFNPDERNMAIAISRFRLPAKFSKIPNCLSSEFALDKLKLTTNKQKAITDNCSLNPHFFAYGQFPLYLSYLSDQIVKPFSTLFLDKPETDNLPAQASLPTQASQQLTTSFSSAIFWLRFYSALSSTLTVLLVYLITKKLLTSHSKYRSRLIAVQKVAPFKSALLPALTSALFAAFSPGLIQSAHFGTTESLLTFFFLASVYFSLKLAGQDLTLYKLKSFQYIILLSLVIGLALGAKLTSLFFFIPPFLTLIIQIIKLSTPRISKRKKTIGLLVVLVFIGLLIFIGSIPVFILSSPYNIIEFENFKSAVFGYEKDVATGKYEAFYTRQFVNTVPILFQVEKIFPYTLGWPIFILGTLGFLLISLSLLLSVFLPIVNQNQKPKIPSASLRAGKNQKKIKKKWKIFAQQGKIFADCIRNLIPKKLRGKHTEIKSRFCKIVHLGTSQFCEQKNFRLRAKNHLLIVLFFSFLIYFLPNSFLFAKWTRFMTPIFPFFAIFAGYFVYHLFNWLHQSLLQAQKSKLKDQKLVKSSKLPALRLVLIFALYTLSLLPGAAFMSIYTHEDVRVTASRWIWQNIKDKSYLLFETANVVDIPVNLKSTPGPPASRTPGVKESEIKKSFQLVSFDFYHLDENSALFDQLLTHLEKADYIFIPSRRIFANYLRLPQKYPLVVKYYQLLFSGRLGFEKVAEFSSFPQFSIFNFQFSINDESAEESFTVFDHPVIRIYRKVKQLTKEGYKSLFEK